MHHPDRVRFAIDRGGTFTDVYAEIPGRPGWQLVKLLSDDPERYSDAPQEAIRRILENIPSHLLHSQSPIDWIRMGTTLATNALLERKGARCALVITKGFHDLLRIGKQNRPRIFDLKIEKHEMVYESVVEVEERVRLLKSAENPENTMSRLGEDQFEIIQMLNVNNTKKKLRDLYKSGIESLAVVCLHGYAFPKHEIMIGDLAAKMGFKHIYLSHQATPRIKLVERGHTTCVEAYLNPVLKDYLKDFRDGFDEIREARTLYMQSDGGLVEARRFSASRALLSGPAGGVVGYAKTTAEVFPNCPVIGFDMGGTSTDVSRFDGEFDWTQESEIAGMFLHVPQLHIHTVAAGGGSRLFFRNRMLEVGPESSGANPGPVCYRKNGFLSLTDANIVLGRVLPGYFPKIFGPKGNQPLDIWGPKNALKELAKQINQKYINRGKMKLSLEQVALGFVRIANETMARAIRDITVAQGFDIRQHVLACFGGAGGQHACAIARSLGISKIFIHRFSGALSAFGMGLADVIEEKSESASLPLDQIGFLNLRWEALENDIKTLLKNQGIDSIEIQRFLNLRYEGTDTAVMIREKDDQTFESAFRGRYLRKFGFYLTGRRIWVDDIWVRGIGKTEKIRRDPIGEKPDPTSSVAKMQCYFDSKWLKTPVYFLEQMGAGECIEGPALLIQTTSTLLVEPGCSAHITEFGDIVIELQNLPKKTVGTELDPIQLSIFANRFMSIAEQMGHALQRTAVSVNIKERQDYSCAIFNLEGNLVANAPHLPVHLGAMGEAVKRQIEIQGEGAKPADVWVTNHPEYGGSHLPDMTVISPVFLKGKPVFYVANRGHHADVGGITPGSMPPFSRSLVEEGVCLRSVKLVEEGVFQEDLLTDWLTGKTQTEGKGECIGTRTLDDNLSDLKAQVAANKRGIDLLVELVEEYSLKVVQTYMKHIQKNAEKAVRNLLVTWNTPEVVEAEDQMDDGTVIHLKLTLDRKKGEAVFDFTGTGAQSPGNINAPRAVTWSAILYSLRCLIENDIPLNQGCLKPIQVIIPEGSLLSPSGDAAVCGGNVLTSQRITDVILKAFGAAAASQGCMNNLTFGNERFGYYETIGGGAGAGPGWYGQSGVHTHMTNTRITDPEILEKYYPVLLREFALRLNSGGEGKFCGGDGLIREFEFLQPLDAAILSERRRFAPFGLHGGGPGSKGQNLWIRRNGETVDLGGKSQIRVNPGDRLRILTPGGGGYGLKT